MNNQSNHYKICKPEAIELIDRYNLNFIEGNIVKYILRSPFKGDRIGDLKKALYYAKKLPEDSGFTWENLDRCKFDIDELDQYLDSHDLYAIEVHAIASVIQGNFYHTITGEYKENYIAKLIEIAIEEREHNEKIEESISKHVKGLADYKYQQALTGLKKYREKTKEFNPDWLPSHPLNTLLDMIDEDPQCFLKRLITIENEIIKEGKDKCYLDSISCLTLFIKGHIREIEILSKIGGSKEFWINRYNNYWEKRKK